MLSRSWKLRCKMKLDRKRYIKGDERSFTIIAYPVPEIGGDYEEIFRQIVKINTLDYQLYQKIQQTLNDTLDTTEWVSVKEERMKQISGYICTLLQTRRSSQFRELCSGCKYSPLAKCLLRSFPEQTVFFIKQVYLEGLQFRRSGSLNLKMEKIVSAYSCGILKMKKRIKNILKIISCSIIQHFQWVNLQSERILRLM